MAPSVAWAGPAVARSRFCGAGFSGVPATGRRPGGTARPQKRAETYAAGLALAGLSGCDDGAPDGVLIPPVLPPDNTVTAGSRMFATASIRDGYANGILVRHAVGRPIKIEGNPLHPASLGGTSAIDQAHILGFYDPDRSRGLVRDGEPQSWSSLLTTLAAQRDTLRNGTSFRILTGTTTSPTLARQIITMRQ
jgi:hypothetical protein